MVKRSFKIGGTGKSVVVVPDADTDAGTMPAINDAEIDRLTIAQMTSDYGLVPMNVDGSDAAQWVVDDVVDTEAEQTAFDRASIADNGAGGTVSADVLTFTQEPDVMWSDAGLVADDDGMGQMRPIMNAESIVVSDIDLAVAAAGFLPGETLAEIAALDAEFEGDSALTEVRPSWVDAHPTYVAADYADDTALDVVVTSAPVVPSLAEIEAESSGLGAYGMGIALSHGMDEYGLEGDAARTSGYSESGLRIDAAAVHQAPIRLAVTMSVSDMARFIGGHTVELTVDDVVIGIMQPVGGGNGGGRKAPKATKAAGNGVAAGTMAKALAHLGGGNVVAFKAAERDWSTYDARVEGGKYSNPALWTKIRDAADRLDLTALRAFDFAGSQDDGRGNTQGQSLGKFLRAWIAKTEVAIAERDAALDAEFGSYRLSAD